MASKMTQLEKDEAYVAFHILAGGVLAVCEVCNEALPLDRKGRLVWPFVHESKTWENKSTPYPNCYSKMKWGRSGGPMSIKGERVSNGGFWIKPTRSMLNRAKRKREKEWQSAVTPMGNHYRKE